jgi:LCP family protein required for cell wall assembly
MTRFRLIALASILVALGLLGNWLGARPYRRPLLAAAQPKASLQPSTVALPIPTQSAALALPSPVAPSRVLPVVAKDSTPPFEYTDNYLLVGLDRRPFGGGAGLADTILVAVFDEPSNAVGLVSIPRDLWVDIPGHGADRINTVMNVARRSSDDPLTLLGRVVENTLGLPIAHSVAIDIGVLERAVDAVGGVTVDVQCPIVDRFLDPRDPSGYRKLDLAVGPAHLDGVTAAMYARSRHGRSDFSRARRQQAIVGALWRELVKPKTLLRLPTLFGQFEASLETDLRRIDVLSLSERLLHVKPEHLHGLVLGVPQVSALRASGGRAVLAPNRAAIARALNQLFSSPSPGLDVVGNACPKADIALSSG